jgi:MoaA/NifB/PqqE/SkfB family radical SAM enzyme
MYDNNRPCLVIWETTQVGAVLTRDGHTVFHKDRHPLELDTTEAQAMIEQVARLQPESFLLSGCDPLAREDLVGLIAFATRQGLRVKLSSAVTVRLASTDFQGLRESGLKQLTLSLDHADSGAEAARALEIAKKSQVAGLQLQAHTTFSRQNVNQFDALSTLIGALRPARWCVFQALPGSASGAEPLTPEQSAWLSERIQHLAGNAGYQIKSAQDQPSWEARLSPQQDSPENRAGAGAIMGNGFLFISHVGGLRPSNFYPISAGNVRVCELGEVYARCAELQRLRRAPACGSTNTSARAVATDSQKHAQRLRTAPAGLGEELVPA